MNDPEGDVKPLEHIDETMWAVYGPESFPSLICCRVLNHPTCGPTIWGYSVYRRQPGFRTLGQDLKIWEMSHDWVYFFNDHDKALAFMKIITTPRNPK